MLHAHAACVSLMKFSTITSTCHFSDFNMYFSDSFVGSLPSLPGGGSSFDQLNAAIGPTIMQFVQSLQTADVSQFITNVNNAIGNAAGTLLGGGNQDTQMCVRRFIASNINQTDIAVVIRGLMNVQRALNSLDRIADFLYRYRMNTEFRFPQNCVRRFIELNFCARCTRRIPPLCSNTCGALYRGCLSPYYTVLSRQFDLLFNVSRQVLRITNNTLQDLFMNERRLIDITRAVGAVHVLCTIQTRLQVYIHTIIMTSLVGQTVGGAGPQD